MSANQKKRILQISSSHVVNTNKSFEVLSEQMQYRAELILKFNF